MFYLSVFLVFLLWLVPLLAAQKLLRFALVFLDRTMSKSLVDTPHESRRLYAARNKEYGLIAWGLTLSLFVFLMIHLPKPPEIEEDNRQAVIRRLSSRGADLLRMQYADSLLLDAAFDAAAVSKTCAAAPPATFESHSFQLQCAFQNPTTVAINVLDAGKLVYSDIWRLP